MCLLSVASKHCSLEAPSLCSSVALKHFFVAYSAEDSKNAPARGARGGTTQPGGLSDTAQFTCAGCPARERTPGRSLRPAREHDGIQRSSVATGYGPGAVGPNRLRPGEADRPPSFFWRRYLCPMMHERAVVLHIGEDLGFGEFFVHDSAPKSPLRSNHPWEKPVARTYERFGADEVGGTRGFARAAPNRACTIRM